MADNPRIFLPQSISDVPGLDTALPGKQATLTGTGDVPGLTDALAGKLSLAGGALTGQVTATQANGTATPRVAITQQHATLLYGQSAFFINNTAGGIGQQVTNAAGGYGVALINSSSGRGLDILNSSTGQGIYVSNTGGSFGIYVANSGAGYGGYFLSNTGATTPALRCAVNTATASGAHALQLTDKSDGTSNAMCMQVDHFGAGFGNNISNRVGASAAFVIHQYSQKSDHAALWIDNCGTQPAIRVWNTENLTLAPGQFGTGRFLDFMRRPSTGAALESCFYVSGEGILCAVPKAVAPSTLADGMVWVEGVGASMHIYARINGVTKQLDN